MYNEEFFKLDENGSIVLIKYKCKCISYFDDDKTTINDIHYFYLSTDDELERLQTNYVAKHRLIELEVEELDTSEFTWMEGIQLRTPDIQTELKKIASYGDIDSYEASLEENISYMILDTDYRISKLELGL